MEFPSSLSSNERAFLHRMAQSLGYNSKSKGWVLHVATCLPTLNRASLIHISHLETKFIIVETETNKITNASIENPFPLTERSRNDY